MNKICPTEYIKRHKKRKTKCQILFFLDLALVLNKWDYSGVRAVGLGL